MPEHRHPFPCQVQEVFSEPRIIFTEPRQPFALIREFDAVSWGCHDLTPVFPAHLERVNSVSRSEERELLFAARAAKGHAVGSGLETSDKLTRERNDGASLDGSQSATRRPGSSAAGLGHIGGKGSLQTI
jgi:hypothetical protein